MQSLYDVEGTFDLNVLDEDSRRVYESEKFQDLLHLDDEELQALSLSVGVDPKSVSKLTALLLLTNTASSWRVLAHADDQSLTSIVKSNIATERRINDLKESLLELGREDSYNLISEYGVPEYPADMYTTIIMNLTPGQLKVLYKTSSAFTRILDNANTIHQLITKFMDEGSPKPRSAINNFKQLVQWLDLTYFNAFCNKVDSEDCLRRAFEDDDNELLEYIIAKKNFILSIEDVFEIIKYDRKDLADLWLNKVRSIVPTYDGGDERRRYMSAMLLIAFYGARELADAKQEMFPSGMTRYYLPNYILFMRTYDRDLVREIVKSSDEGKRYTPKCIGMIVPPMGIPEWYPELVTDAPSYNSPTLNNVLSCPKQVVD